MTARCRCYQLVHAAFDAICLPTQWCVGADPKLADNVTDYAPFYSNRKCTGLVQNTVNTFLNRTNTGASDTLGKHLRLG